MRTRQWNLSFTLFIMQYVSEFLCVQVGCCTGRTVWVVGFEFWFILRSALMTQTESLSIQLNECAHWLNFFGGLDSCSQPLDGGLSSSPLFFPYQSEPESASLARRDFLMLNPYFTHNC